MVPRGGHAAVAAEGEGEGWTGSCPGGRDADDHGSGVGTLVLLADGHCGVGALVVVLVVWAAMCRLGEGLAVPGADGAAAAAGQQRPRRLGETPATAAGHERLRGLGEGPFASAVGSVGAVRETEQEPLSVASEDDVACGARDVTGAVTNGYGSCR